MEHYLVVVGTNRSDSNSAKIGQVYYDKIVSLNLNVEMIDMIDLPKSFVFDHAFGKKMKAFDSFQNLVSAATKFIFIIPEYNGSFPGVLKAFIDCCEFPISFSGKKCCLVGLSSGQFGNLRGLEHFSGVANYVKMNVYHEKTYLPGVEKDLLDDGVINDPKIIKHIDRQINGFIKF